MVFLTLFHCIKCTPWPLTHNLCLICLGGDDNHLMHDHASESSGDDHMSDYDTTIRLDTHVDQEAFCHLLTRTKDLEKQVARLTKNISHMSDLFNQFMCQQATSG